MSDIAAMAPLKMVSDDLPQFYVIVSSDKNDLSFRFCQEDLFGATVVEEVETILSDPEQERLRYHLQGGARDGVQLLELEAARPHQLNCGTVKSNAQSYRQFTLYLYDGGPHLMVRLTPADEKNLVAYLTQVHRVKAAYAAKRNAARFGL